MSFSFFKWSLSFFNSIELISLTIFLNRAFKLVLVYSNVFLSFFNSIELVSLTIFLNKAFKLVLVYSNVFLSFFN